MNDNKIRFDYLKYCYLKNIFYFKNVYYLTTDRKCDLKT